MKGIVAIIILFMSMSVFGEDVPTFKLSVPVSPDSDEEVSILSYDGINIDLDNFYEVSKETGYYPEYGWTGSYYEYGVTHGPVEHYNFIDSPWQEELMPEPNSLIIFIILLLILFKRREKI